MKLGKFPLSVLIVSCLYIAAGATGFVYHFLQLSAFHSEDIWIEAIELLAFVAGVFMLRGRNWARWLAVAWMAFHLAISFPGGIRPIAVHSLFLAVIAGLLFQPRAGQYFAGKDKERN